MTRTILPTITLIALAMLPGSSAAPPTALSATPATPGTAANPDVFCCTITCKSCVQVDCSKDDTGCYHVLPWRYCCALALEAVSGVYTNVKGEVVTIESVA